MILNTKQFKEVANTILLAVDNGNEFSTNLQLSAHDNFLYLSVTNKEYYASVRFPLEESITFRAVVEAPLFLNLVSGINTETFVLENNEQNITIKVGKSNYKLAKIFENNQDLTLPPIILDNRTVEMTISNDILKSIVNVNSKEIAKAKNLDVSELQKLYYITNEGCFTFTSGACLNNFMLEKPIKLLLNERVVKLFKLFKTDVHFSFGVDQVNNKEQTKICLETEDTYLAAYITNDNLLLEKVSRPCEKTRDIIKEQYQNKLVISANILSAALSRLMLFIKNSDSSQSAASVQAKFVITSDELAISDSDMNTECIQLDNNSFCDSPYEMTLYLGDLKAVLDSCKDEHITINCGNHQSVVITHGAVSNLIPEV